MGKKKAKKSCLLVRLLKLLLPGKKKSGKKSCAFCRVFGKLLRLLAAVYAILFAVFYFDLDGKLLYYVVEPFLAKHYDRMERKNPLDMPYDIK